MQAEILVAAQRPEGRIGNAAYASLQGRAIFNKFRDKTTDF